MGYTPLFDTLTKGSLCGKWPDIGLWSVVLSMADWRGEIRATHQYIASVTGLHLDEVRACMKRFCDPDPESSSSNDEGRRLLLLNDESGWGWKVINIQKYRDKASGTDQIADGRNAEKVKRYKERHRQTPADTGNSSGTPTGTPTHTADSDSDSDSDESKSKSAREGVPRGTNNQCPEFDNETEHAEWEATFALYPPGAQRSDPIAAEKAARQLVESGSVTWPQLREGVSRYAACVKATERLVLNPAKFFTDRDKPWSQLWPIPPPKKPFSAADRITWKPDDDARSA